MSTSSLGLPPEYVAALDAAIATSQRVAGGSAQRALIRDAARVYVDGLNGSDANPGTAAAPCATVQTALLAAGAAGGNTGPETLMVHLAGGADGAVQDYPVRVLDVSGGRSLASSIRFVGPAMVGPAAWRGLVVSTVNVGIHPSEYSVVLTAAPTPALNADGETGLAGWFACIKRAGQKRYYELDIASASGAATFTIRHSGISIIAGDTIDIVRPGARLVAPTEGGQRWFRVDGAASYVGMLSATFSRLSLQGAIISAHGLGLDRCVLDMTDAVASCAILDGASVSLVNCAVVGTGGAELLWQGRLGLSPLQIEPVDAADVASEADVCGGASFVAARLTLDGPAADFAMEEDDRLCFYGVSAIALVVAFNSARARLGKTWGANAAGKGATVFGGAHVVVERANHKATGSASNDLVLETSPSTERTLAQLLAASAWRSADGSQIAASDWVQFSPTPILVSDPTTALRAGFGEDVPVYHINRGGGAPQLELPTGQERGARVQLVGTGGVAFVVTMADDGVTQILRGAEASAAGSGGTLTAGHARNACLLEALGDGRWIVLAETGTNVLA